MVTITLPSELENAVTREAAERGTTAELLSLKVLQERFLSPPAPQFSEGATLADLLADYIGAVDTRDKYLDGSTLSENTGRRFGQLMVEKHDQGKL